MTLWEEGGSGNLTQFRLGRRRTASQHLEGKTISVSVIMPVHAASDDFRLCLNGVAGTRPPPNEIVVVSDGPDPEVARICEEFDVRLIVSEQRGGPARARNLGAAAAEGDILFFVDSDALVPENAVAQIREAFARDPAPDAVIGSYDTDPAARNFLSQYKNLSHHYYHQTAREDASTFWGACGAIRRAAFLRIGGFNESYRRPSVEDIDLGYRLRSAGGRICLRKTLQVKHLKRWGFRSLLQADIWGRAVPWTELILRHRDCADDSKNLRASSRLSVVLAWTVALCVAASFWRIEALLGAAVLCAVLFWLNAGLYRFLNRLRGPWFAIRSALWNGFYFFYGGLGFAIGLARYVLRCVRRVDEDALPGGTATNLRDARLM